MVVDAVIRNFQVIGEAAKHIPDYIKNEHPEIAWKRMKRMTGMRDKIIHEYSVLTSIFFGKPQNPICHPPSRFLRKC
jgi:uncharacterized protein with HEPN domain